MGRKKSAFKKMGFQQLIFLGLLLVIAVGSLIEVLPMWLAAIFAMLVGLVNITVKETQKTLIAALVLIMGSGVLLAFNNVPLIGDYLGSLFTNVALYLGIVGVFAGIKEMILRSRN